MSARDIRALLDAVELDDNHAFATAYVRHVEATGERPSLAVSARNWARTGRI
jgi:hypothetical protein